MTRPHKITLFITLAIGVAVVAVYILSLDAQKQRQVASGGMNMNATLETTQKNGDNLGGIIDLTTQSEITMDIRDFKYEKPNIKIKKGTRVTWTNRDAVKHNVMAEHEGSDKVHSAPTIEQVNPNEFAGPLLAKGESYSFTFNKVSSAPYHCSPHPFMKGSVTVVD